MDPCDWAIELAPDVVLFDIQMPERSGVEATRRMLEERPQTHILVLKMFDGDSSVFAAVRAGAKGFLLNKTSNERSAPSPPARPSSRVRGSRKLMRHRVSSMTHPRV